MRGFAPRKYPASGLQPGLHRKTTFCFSAGITCRQTFKKSCSSQHSPPSFLYRAPHFPAPTTSRPAPAGNSLSPHIFSYQPTQPHASPQPSFRLDRPVYSRSHSFSLFLLFHSIPHTSTHKKKETGKADFPLFLLQSQI